MSVRRSPNLRFGTWDALVALMVVLLAAATAFAAWRGHDGGPRVAVISVDGVQGEAIPLTETASYTVSANGVTLEISTENGEIWVESSDCPTQDCVHTGHISRGGQSIVCLPARVIITLEGPADNGGGPDIVIG